MNSLTYHRLLKNTAFFTQNKTVTEDFVPDRFLVTAIACTFFGGSAQLSCALIFNARGYVFVEHYRVI